MSHALQQSGSSRTRSPRRLRPLARALVAFMLLALTAGVASAQESVSAPVSETAEPKNADPDAARAIPLVEIAAQGEQVAVLIRKLATDLEANDPGARLETALSSYAAAIDARTAETSALLASLPTLDDLREFEAAWQAQRGTLSEPSSALSTRIVRLDERLAQLAKVRERWSLTRKAVTESDSPDALLQGIEQTIAALDASIKRVKQHRSSLLSLQSRLANEQGRITSAIEEIQDRRAEVFGNLFAQTSAPLWQGDRRLRSMHDVREALGRSLDADRERTVSFLAQHRSTLGLHTLLLVVMIFALRIARVRLMSRDETDGPSSLHVLHHPLALALLLALLVTGWLYPEMPFALGSLVFAAALPAVIVIARDYTPPSMRPVLYALGVFCLLDLARDMVAPLAWLSRVAFASEMILVVGFGIWLLRPARLASLSGGEELGPGLRSAGVLARIVLLASLGAVLLEAVGYTRLAQLVGNGVLRSAYAALLLYAAAHALHGVGAFLLRRRPLRLLQMVTRHRGMLEQRLARLLGWIAVALGSWSVLENFALWQPLSSAAAAALGARLEVGELSLSLSDVAVFSVTVWLSFVIAAGLRFLLNEEVFPRVQLSRGVPYALSTLLGYGILLLGFLFALAAAGIDLNRFTLLAGAFGVGIGFGLQNIVNNFVSGLILLFERPVQVGDMLQLQDVGGEMRHIGIRASTVRTWEGADVVVPNGELISQRVTNWTLSDRNRRIDLVVGVAYGSRPRDVVALLLRLAEDFPEVLTVPAPQALFTGFGDSSLNFVLRVWTGDADRWLAVRSELGMTVCEALEEAGFEIPFPQRDLHLRDLPLSLADLRPAPQPDDTVETQRGD